MHARPLRLLPYLLAALATAVPPAAAAPAAAPTPPPPVKGYPVGCFTRLDPGGLEEVKAAGFEFAEVGLRNAVTLSDADFDQLAARVKALGLPVLAAINFLPPELKVVGPEVDRGKQDEYLGRAFARAQRLGLKVVVFGSGRSRTAPEGFSADEAFRQLVEFSRRAAGLAAKHKLRIGIEPLGKEEAGLIHTVAEGVKLARAVGHPAFGLVVDYYHLSKAGEDPAVLVQARNRLYHVRIANPTGRAFPRAAGEADYAGFFARLKQIGYRGGIGIEARTGTVAADGPTSVALLRTLAGELIRRSR
jgi:D-psicose/D-tagatose/L-ribulose 3-epimerase